MPTKKFPPQKTVTESVLFTSVQEIISNKPGPSVTAAPVMGKWMASAWAFFRRGRHECFLASWHCGEILAAVRSKCPHGNKKNRTELTFDEWVEEHISFIGLRTAERWSDIFNHVKPENTPDFDSLNYTEALEIAEARKKMLKDERDRSEKRETAKQKKKSPSPEKKKPVKPIGNYVSQIKSSALGLRDAISNYASSDTRSTSIECDKL